MVLVVGFYTAVVFKVPNLGAALSDIDQWLEDVEESIVEDVRYTVRAMFFHIIEETPQWSGNAVANWRVSINSPVGAYDDIFKTLAQDRSNFTPFAKGSTQAMNYAYEMSRDELGAVRTLSDVAYITNATPYVGSLEGNTIKLRTVNLPGEMVSRAIERLADEGGVPVGTQYNLGV